MYGPETIHQRLADGQAALSLGGVPGSFADDSKSGNGDKNKMKIPIRLYKTPW